MADEPATEQHKGNILGRKYGPLPLWGWIVIGAAGLVVMLRYRKKAAPSSQTGNLSASVPYGQNAAGVGYQPTFGDQIGTLTQELSQLKDLQTVLSGFAGGTPGGTTPGGPATTGGSQTGIPAINPTQWAQHQGGYAYTGSGWFQDASGAWFRPAQFQDLVNNVQTYLAVSPGQLQPIPNPGQGYPTPESDTPQYVSVGSGPTHA